MKQTFIIFIALMFGMPLAAGAQDAPGTLSKPAAANTALCLHAKKIRLNSSAVAQGGRIEVTVPLEATNCEVVYRQPERLLSPQGLVIDEPSPFRLYPGSTFKNDRLFKNGEDASSAAISRKLEYRLALEALPNAPVGTQHLVIRVSYESVDKAGMHTPREQTFSVPITVVPMGTAVEASSKHKFRDVTVTVLLGIAMAPLIPLMLLGGIVQYIQDGQWPSC